MRIDGRTNDELRTIKIEPNYIVHPDGSCLVEFGLTRVICSAKFEDRVPPFLKGSGEGWITAEYGMLPSSTLERTAREATKGRPSGRSLEIQRLIGRSLRCVVDTRCFPDKTLWVDCDVIQADGGTRCASITGAFVAMGLAFNNLLKKGVIKDNPIKSRVSAVSVGILNGEKILDLKYEEDSRAEVDMNVVMTGDGRYVEVQGTAEQKPFNKKDLDELLYLAARGIDKIIEAQKEVVRFDFD
jgi:ribonuclease PH